MNAKVKFEFEGITGYWVLIKYKEKTGYVFDGFLSKLPAPSLYKEHNFMAIQEYFEYKIGKVDQLIILGSVRIYNEMDGDTSTFEHTLQKYKNGAELNLAIDETGAVYTYKIPKITLEEAFLLVKMCQGEYLRDMKLPIVNSKIRYETDTHHHDSVDVITKVKRDGEGFVRSADIELQYSDYVVRAMSIHLRLYTRGRSNPITPVKIQYVEIIYEFPWYD